MDGEIGGRGLDFGVARRRACDDGARDNQPPLRGPWGPDRPSRKHVDSLSVRLVGIEQFQKSGHVL